jgi:hypothetical protein
MSLTRLTSSTPLSLSTGVVDIVITVDSFGMCKANIRLALTASPYPFAQVLCFCGNSLQLCVYFATRYQNKIVSFLYYIWGNIRELVQGVLGAQVCV